MSKRRGYKNPTKDQREAAVRRVLKDEAPLLVARESGVSLQTLNHWIDRWCHEAVSAGVLPTWMVDAGYQITTAPRYGYGSGQTLKLTRHGERNASKRSVIAFTEAIATVPANSRERIARVYAELHDDVREVFAPALDAYLRAVELMDEVRRLQAVAFTIVAQETAQVTP